MNFTMKARTASPIDQARAALEAIDPQPHVDRRDSFKIAIAKKEAAVDEAQARLQDIHGRMRDHGKPDGQAVAHSLLTGEKLPPVNDDLVREKDQLVAGIGELNRQIRDHQNALREPFDDLKRQARDAMEPYVDDLKAKAQAAIELLEDVYAATEALRRVGPSGDSEGLRIIAGAMLFTAREQPRRLEFQAEIAVDPALVALKDVEVMQAMRAHIPAAVGMPTWSILRE